MAKTTNIEIKDLPLLTLYGVEYYAFNVALKYLKQNNKSQFKGITMKKFKEIYGEDSIFKLTGCGSWITVEFFNQLVADKVVVEIEDEVEVEQEEEVVEEVVSDTISTCENEPVSNDTDVVEEVVEQEVKPRTEPENAQNKGVMNPYVEQAIEYGFDLSANHCNSLDCEFRGGSSKQIEATYNSVMRSCKADMTEEEFNRWADAADYWELHYLAKEWDKENGLA